MIQKKKMCGGKDLDSELCVVIMIQIVKTCGGNDLDNDLDNENVWW